MHQVKVMEYPVCFFENVRYTYFEAICQWFISFASLSIAQLILEVTIFSKNSIFIKDMTF